VCVCCVWCVVCCVLRVSWCVGVICLSLAPHLLAVCVCASVDIWIEVCAKPCITPCVINYAIILVLANNFDHFNGLKIFILDIGSRRRQTVHKSAGVLGSRNKQGSRVA
jgi:hypothetical protein